MSSKRVIFFAALLALCATSAFAGGLGVNTNTLNLGGPPATGKLDLANTSMIVNTGSITPTITSWVAQGFNGGGWDATAGIVSANAALDPLVLNLGILSGDDYASLNGSADFYGAAYTSATSMVKYTYSGDLDFDGMVTGTDYFWIDLWYQTQEGGPIDVKWATGDFDHDGFLTGTDYFYIDIAYQTIDGGGGYGVLSGLGGIQTVPEPSSLILVLTCALALFVWKKIK